MSTSKSASSSSPVPDRAPRRPGTPVVPAAGEVPAAEESRTPTRRRRKATAAATAPAQAPAAEQPVLAPPADHDADRAGGGAPARIRTSDEGGPDRTSDAAETSAVDGAEGDRSSEGSGGSEGAEDTDDEGAAAAAEGGEAAEEAGGADTVAAQSGASEQAPYLPAASLLFQAPDPARARRRRRKATAAATAPAQAPAAEQPAPVTAEGPDDETASSASDSGGTAPTAPRAGGRRRRRATAGQAAPEHAEAPAGASADSQESTGREGAGNDSRADEQDGAGRRRRRRGGRGRRARSRTEERQETEGTEKAEKADSRASAGDGSGDAPGSAEEEAAPPRRRRRRSRSRARSDAGRDPRDEVTALKGSTRLEAKRQRRREGRAAGRRRPIVTEAEFLARRESVDRQMIVREQDGLNQIALLEDGLLVEHYVARHTQTSMVGNVYVGRVQNVLPSMEAAFVDLGKGRNAVLYAGEVNWDAAGMEGKPRRIEDALSSGDTVLVQVTKDPIGHKGARLTSQITLAGRYLVLVPGGTMTGISRKLPDTERVRLKKILKRIVPDDAGVIVRTAAEGASEDQLAADVNRLLTQWRAIDKKASSVFRGSSKAPVLLKGEPELAVRVVRDVFNEDFRRLVVQGSGAWKTISQYVGELSPDLEDRLEHWVSPEDVFSAHRVDEQLAKGFDRKVWLPSGGTLVIDRTEAMTVIDVNTGRFTGGAGGTLEETVTRNNLEAAEEIVRQLRLRDIGGMVVIDFVDMVLESNRDLVLRRLVECLGRDRTRHQVTEVTSLGLVQMTRKRVGQGLVEAFSTPCECCGGRGFIVHDNPVENQTADGPAPSRRGSGSGRRGRRNREESAPARSSSRSSGSSEASSEPDAPVHDDAARAAVRGALAQIAAAAEHAHEHADIDQA
ncbi:Rne/Rng family ribonuclease [Actinomyces gerencseriae]|mgnify:CR=1 FL=1|uniref:Rne/Rng family ribonuclease n=1 Tax=Actinomyces gerencseriae TaxID=52769 RepID=UPI003C6C3A2C